MRFDGSKGLLEETTLEAMRPFWDWDESIRERIFLGLEEKKKRKATAEAKAPKTVAVETRVSSREFIEFQSSPGNIEENLLEILLNALHSLRKIAGNNGERYGSSYTQRARGPYNWQRNTPREKTRRQKKKT